MDEQDIANVHFMLWDAVEANEPTSIQVDGNTFICTRLLDQARGGRDFAIIEINGLTMASQNTRKNPASSERTRRNLEWLKAESGRKLTWCMRGETYVGKVESWIDNGVEMVRVVKLHPYEETILKKRR